MSVVQTASLIQLIGAWGFGTLLGWYTYYINRYRKEAIKQGDLVTLISVLGGGAILTLFPASTDLFGAYGLGLVCGFFGYFFVLNLYVLKSQNFTVEWFLDGRCIKPKGTSHIPKGSRKTVTAMEEGNEGNENGNV